MTARVLDLTARLAQAEAEAAPCPCPADRLDRLAGQLREHLAATEGQLLVPGPSIHEALGDVLAVVDTVLANYPPHQRPQEARC